jgi:hypothetical protein
VAEATNYLVYAVLMGAGATAIMDGWTAVRKRLLGVAPLDYGLVGRWIGHLPRGRFRHDQIAGSPPVRGERLIGWAAHYLIGIVLAAMLLAIWGLDWVHHPTIGPPLVVGVGSVTFPFLLMQPGMGLGVAASRTSRPMAARLHSLLTHAIFGLGLYVSGGLAGSLNML